MLNCRKIRDFSVFTLYNLTDPPERSKTVLKGAGSDIRQKTC